MRTLELDRRGVPAAQPLESGGVRAPNAPYRGQYATAFEPPEGVGRLDEQTQAAVAWTMRQAGLNDAQARRAMQFHWDALQQTLEQQHQDHWAMRGAWREEIMESDLGPILETKVLPALGKMYAMLPAGLRKEFIEGLDFTGAGDNPGVLRGFLWIAERLTEGGHVKGSPPSKSAPQSIANAMYGHLLK
jgi:hypothetical protein